MPLPPTDETDVTLGANGRCLGTRTEDADVKFFFITFLFIARLHGQKKEMENTTGNKSGLTRSQHTGSLQAILNNKDESNKQ